MERKFIGAVGTRGDVAPAIALGRSLRARFEVVLAAPPENRIEAEEAGLRFVPVGDDFSEVVARGGLAGFRDQVRRQFAACAEEAKRADAVIGFSLFYAGPSLAEAAGRPYDHVFFEPRVFRSRSLAPLSEKASGSDGAKLASAWKRWDARENFILSGALDAGRRDLGLAPLRDACSYRSPASSILAVDPILARPPDDLEIRQAHYWEGAEGPALDAATREFLESGDPPVLFCLGSASASVRASLLILERAASRAAREGLRSIILHPGLPDAASASNGALRARFLPFRSLLPRCAALVHQGGIGSLFEAALAGIPQVAAPWILDQFAWAGRIEALGVGMAERGPRSLASGAFAKRLKRLLDSEDVRAKARGLSLALSSPGRKAEQEKRIRELFG